MNDIFNFFLDAYKKAPTYFILLEAVAFTFGIASVLYAKKANILVYPTGLVATIITVYLLYKAQYYGDMMMNFYYAVMSIYGWYHWAGKHRKPSIPITVTNTKEKQIGFLLFVLTMIVTYMVYAFFDYPMQIPNYIDIVTSGIFFTAMWYMAIKKLENWVLWIIGDIITIPLYAYRGMGMLSLQYIIFTILAIQGYLVWKEHLNKNPALS